MTNLSYFLTGHGETLLPAESGGTISANIARHALVKHLISLAKEGVVSVGALADGDLLHVVSLTPRTAHPAHAAGSANP
jgi:hypothetical protein